MPVPCERQPPGLGAPFAWKSFRLTHPNTQPTPDIHAFRHSSSPIIPPEPPALVLLSNPDPTTHRPSLPQTTISATLYPWCSFNPLATTDSRSNPSTSRCSIWPLRLVRAHISLTTSHLHYSIKLCGSSTSSVRRNANPEALRKSSIDNYPHLQGSFQSLKAYSLYSQSWTRESTADGPNGAYREAQ